MEKSASALILSWLRCGEERRVVGGKGAGEGRKGREGTNLLEKGKNLLVHCQLVEVESDGSDDLVDHSTIHTGNDLVRHRAERREGGEGVGGR